AVPHDAGPQLGEVLARVAAGEHVEDGVEGGVAEGLERGAATDQRGELVDGPVLDGEHGDDLLGEDVEGVGDDVQRLDRALLGPYRGDGCGEEVAAVGGQDDAAGQRPDLVPGAADALEGGGDRRRGADLDDEVDRAHVDPELEGGGGDDGGQAPGLERRLDPGALLAAHRAVVGAGDLAVGGGGGRAGLAGHLRRPAGAGRPVRLRVRGPVALGPDLVDASGEPLGAAPGVGEDDG